MNVYGNDRVLIRRLSPHFLERTDEPLKNSSHKGFRAAISTRAPAKYSHDRPPTRGHTQKWRK